MIFSKKKKTIWESYYITVISLNRLRIYSEIYLLNIRCRHINFNCSAHDQIIFQECIIFNIDHMS